MATKKKFNTYKTKTAGVRNSKDEDLLDLAEFYPDGITLRTGRDTVSFSQLSMLNKCAFSWKLRYVEKIKTEFRDDVYNISGGALHDAIEKWLKGAEISAAKEAYVSTLTTAWEKNQFDSPEWVSAMTERAAKINWNYKHDYLEEWLRYGETVLDELPDWMDEKFPGWKFLESEYKFETPVPGSHNIKLSGLIDCVIQYEEKGKTIYHIIDWKTVSARGWMFDKKTDENVINQLGTYKLVYSQSHNIPPAQIRCSYVFLKRNRKNKVIEEFRVAFGPKKMKEIANYIAYGIQMMSGKMFVKNTTACQFCEYNLTEHCTYSLSTPRTYTYNR